MTAIPVLADREMAARYESVCITCGAMILPGQRIARCPGGLWIHTSCFIGHRHNLEVDR